MNKQSDNYAQPTGAVNVSPAYAIAGTTIARLTDRANRRSIIAIGRADWSAITVATGFSKNFLHLVIARVGVFVLVLRLTAKEPARGLAENRGVDSESSTLKQTSSHLLGSPSWVCLMVGALILWIIGYGIIMWGYEWH